MDWINQPPTHLSAISKLIDESEDWFSPYTDHVHFKHFKLICTCGNTTFSIATDYREEDDCIALPITVTCCSCCQKTVLFDDCIHGYDGKFGHYGTREYVPGNQTIYCSKCQNATVEIIYAVEPCILDDDEHYLYDEMPYPQDYFWWFSLFTKCDDCQDTMEFLSFECA
jgi:hypothetical protein